VLQDALTGQRAQLVDATTASDPELVVVFDLAGTVDQFMRACAQIDGLEFLADLQEDQVDADDDFYYEDSSGDIGDDGVPQSLYMVMSNARAVDELVRLFELWQDDPSTKFDRGLNSLKQVFGLLRSIRRWDTQDRIRETGLLEDWQQHVEPAALASRSNSGTGATRRAARSRRMLSSSWWRRRAVRLFDRQPSPASSTTLCWPTSPTHRSRRFWSKDPRPSSCSQPKTSCS
jgi:hypothetical protein